MSLDNTFTTSAPPDTTPPVISGIAASNVTNIGATIAWTTNEAASSQVEYGTTTAYGSSTALNSTLVTSHSMSLASLTASTTYHYRVKSTDGAGNLAMSLDNTFTTSAPPDTTPPVISGIAASNVTNIGATIAWTTNEASSSQVEYGTTTAYGSSTTLNSTLVTGHSMSLASLTASTTYHYRVRSTDGAGNLAMSLDNTFTTSAPPDTTPPVLSLITASSLTSSSAMITWGTNEASTTQVEFGTTTAYGNMTTINSTLSNSHSQNLTGLIAGMFYHYRVRSTDASGNLSVSGDFSFTTLSAADTTPPGDVEKFTAHPADKKVTLTWTDPPDSDYVGVRIIYRTDHYPTDMNDGQLLGDFTGSPNQKISTLQNGLNNDVTYYYAAHSYDSSGNFQSTAYASATPTASLSSSATGSKSDSVSGGCGMIRPTKGNSQGPGSAADMLLIPAMAIILLLKKRLKIYTPAGHGQLPLPEMVFRLNFTKGTQDERLIIRNPISIFKNAFQIFEIFGPIRPAPRNHHDDYSYYITMRYI